MAAYAGPMRFKLHGESPFQQKGTLCSHKMHILDFSGLGARNGPCKK